MRSYLDAANSLLRTDPLLVNLSDPNFAFLYTVWCYIISM
jgi:hypothetical protein